MDQEQQTGWKFEPWEDGDPEGYYTFRWPDSPVYGLAEPVCPGEAGPIRACVCLEEGDDEIGRATYHGKMAEAKAAVVERIGSILQKWQVGFVWAVKEAEPQ